MAGGNIPDYVMVCCDGHVTDSRTSPALRGLGDNPPFDFTVYCRRKNPAYLATTYGRCHERVYKINDFPALVAAYRLGGEDAVTAIVTPVLGKINGHTD